MNVFFSRVASGLGSVGLWNNKKMVMGPHEWKKY
jgi:hypothetical protein